MSSGQNDVRPPATDANQAKAAAGSGADEMASDLARRFGERLRFFAARRLRDTALAEDVAQEVLRRTFEALKQGRVENAAALPAFLFQTARYVCMQKARSAGREARALQRLGGVSQEEHPQDPLAGLISEERRQQVREALTRLGPADQELLRLTYMEAVETSEIAARLDVSAGAVRVRRHRALARLAECLGVTDRSGREL